MLHEPTIVRLPVFCVFLSGRAIQLHWNCTLDTQLTPRFEMAVTTHFDPSPEPERTSFQSAAASRSYLDRLGTKPAPQVSAGCVRGRKARDRRRTRR